MFGERPYCKNPTCAETRIGRGTSVSFAVLGSLILSSIFVIRLNDDMMRSLGQWAPEPHWLALGTIVAAVFVTGMFAAYERFRSTMTAFIYGVSQPGLVFGIASVALPS